MRLTIFLIFASLIQSQAIPPHSEPVRRMAVMVDGNGQVVPELLHWQTDTVRRYCQTMKGITPKVARKRRRR